MLFKETSLLGAFVLEVKRIEDDRGFFGRSFCAREMEAHGLNPRVINSNIGFSKRKGTLRGMHFQVAPSAEAKLVRCTMGEIYDVILDLRPESPTHGDWFGIQLTAENRTSVYVPEGFAHGYQTLRDNTEVCYDASAFYVPESARGVRYNDRTFGIKWPLEISSISKNDLNWPDYVV